jgi:hypothetical protein
MNVGSAFLFTQNLDRILFWGRLPMLLLGLLLAIFVFWWSWELHGNAGAALPRSGHPLSAQPLVNLPRSCLTVRHQHQ